MNYIPKICVNFKVYIYKLSKNYIRLRYNYYALIILKIERESPIGF